MNAIRLGLYRIFQDEQSERFFVANNIFAVVILISVITVILETVPSLGVAYEPLFITAEMFFLVFFGLEYALRIYSAPDRWGYVMSPLGLIDLLALLPSVFLFGLFTAPVPLQELWVFRLLRILRLLRTIRLVRFLAPTRAARERISKAMSGIHWINVEIYLFTLMIVVVFSATLMYLAEGGVEGTKFTSIPDSMWWAIVTITTVGYGDFVPVTLLGKLIAAATMISGLALFALMLVVIGQIAQQILFGSSLKDRTEP